MIPSNENQPIHTTRHFSRKPTHATETPLVFFRFESP
ncbi:unnamed protein product [Haemonchus placei]|uniref:Uncharacterized protein n=1 Tax=Haemonchus placei TaxID=6290 RepID=A0A0N4WRS6_HAEPC|nr:unnamed protein product [Haemonchus placei]